jgi:tetratricopeptide (TPR) repeat protein
MSPLGSRKGGRIEKLLDDAAALPIGPEERALLDEAVRLADEAGEEELAYRARMLLTPSAHMSGDTDTMLASFGWCVGKHDADPVRFPIDPGVHVDLLFQYKWMASRLASNSRFSRERVEAIHRDMEQRYREAGVGQSGVLQSKHDVAMLMGDVEAAARHLVERDALERDEYSHCEACVRSSDATFARVQGDDEGALRLWAEILEQNLSCGEEPEFAESEALLPLLRAGRTEEALAAHARSYRAARSHPDGFPIIANHLVFCALTGNLARGLSLLERHIDGLAHDPYHEASHFEGLCAVGVLLDAVVDAGEGDTRVRGSNHPALEPLIGASESPRSAAELRELAWSAAADIAARFDTRNGNDSYAGRLADRRALREVRFDAPFGGEAFAPQPATRARPSDATGWLALARTRLFAADASGVREAVEAGLAHADAAVTPDLLKTLVWVSIQSGDLGAARAHHAERIAVLREAGWAEQADLEERLGLTLLGHGTPDDIPALAAELERARAEASDANTVIDLLATLGSLQLEAGDPAAAVTLLDEADGLLGEDDPHFLRFSVTGARQQALAAVGRTAEAARLAQRVIDDPRNAGFPLLGELRLRAQLLASAGELEEALGYAERLLGEAVASEVSIVIAQAAQLAAMILDDLERPAEAAARTEFALRHAERAEQPTIGLRFMLARIQLGAGEALAALENFETVYLEEKASAADPAAIAETALNLGRAAMAAGEPGMAYGAWSETVGLAEQGEAIALAADAGVSLGNLLLQFGDAESVEVFERALANARRAESLGAVANALHGLGRARVLRGDDAGLAELDEAIALAESDEAAWFAANVRDSKGRCLIDLGRLEEGIGVVLGAADGLAAEGDAMTAASGEAYAARALVAAERGEEAVAILRGALDRIEPGTPPHTGIALELAELLDALGRPAEAAELRDGAA